MFTSTLEKHIVEYSTKEAKKQGKYAHGKEKKFTKILTECSCVNKQFIFVYTSVYKKIYTPLSNAIDKIREMWYTCIH